ncbi:MAG TPA: acyl carrier protein [Micromonosporaceae bacterium]|nr:acyl carrier protein [Micromonosporaceae bacterium]
MGTLVEERREEIRAIVADILEIEVDELTDTAPFKETYGTDSLRAIEILAALERRLDIVIDQAELARMVHLQGVYDVVADAASA